MVKYQVKTSMRNYLNVRTSPDVTSPSIGKLYPGDPVYITDFSNGWGYVRDWGWCSMDYIDIISDESKNLDEFVLKLTRSEIEEVIKYCEGLLNG